MLTSDLNYELPKELIAQKPLPKRDDSRLMVVDRKSGSIYHRRFFEITEFLKTDDLLVFNNTKVDRVKVPATKENGGKIELTFLSLNGKTAKLFVKGRVKIGDELKFANFKLKINTVGRQDPPVWQATLDPALTHDDLQKIGSIMLPPYIKSDVPEKDYQTVFAKVPGSIAAPTAGLHFTPRLLKKIFSRGVRATFVTLNVGPGTFLPIKVSDTNEHIMHKERFEISATAANLINSCLSENKRIVAIGTTSLRCLESAAVSKGKIKAISSQTELFITPGYDFKIVGALLTNFHLPKSTLLALVYAFGGSQLIKKAYTEAVNNKYRFFSFGDAMLII